MSPQFSIGSGSTTNALLDTILQHLDSMEAKLQSLECHFAGMGGDEGGTLHTDDGSGALTMGAHIGYRISASGLSMGNTGDEIMHMFAVLDVYI
jgi:hypothetical protein